MIQNCSVLLRIVFFSLLVSSACSRDGLELQIDIGDTATLTSGYLNPQSQYIIVFGDLQVYTQGPFIGYYQSSCTWIRKQFDNGIIIKSILQVGDVTQNNTTSQWSLFWSESQGLSSVIPFFVCTGNHDYSWSSSKIYDRSTTRINDYAHFPLVDDRISCYYEEGDMSNYVAVLLPEKKISLLALEFGPREEVVDWALDYVSKHSEELFIVMTHEWLNAKGQRISEESDAELQLKGYSSFSTPEQLWKRLVEPNDNILCVLCGHEGFSKTLFTKNDRGRDVPQIMFNLQYLPHGGDGLIQIWEFPDNSNEIKICAFDTVRNSWHQPHLTSVSFTYRN